MLRPNQPDRLAVPVWYVTRTPARLVFATLTVAMLAVALLAAATPASAGVTNPKISILGQPSIVWTDDAENPDRKRPVLDIGETEIIYDDYLNPYASGYFTLAIAEEGLELEEGYFTLFRGLPGELALKGGQYRVPFGRINPTHPHALPFAEPFEVVSSYLPGEEALIEPGVELSRRIPIVGDVSVEVQADWLQGNSFRVEREADETDSTDPLNSGGDDGAELTRPAFFGRLSGFGMLGERSALEVGLSAVGGTNNVDAGTRTYVYGADAKAKLWTSPQSYLVLQGELLSRSLEEAAWEDGGYVSNDLDSVGGYLFADFNWASRYNVGASFEVFEEPVARGGEGDATRDGNPTMRGLGLFGGIALMEETTAIRLDWKRLDPDEGDGSNTLTLRVIYSMGPHKAHQF